MQAKKIPITRMWKEVSTQEDGCSGMIIAYLINFVKVVYMRLWW